MHGNGTKKKTHTIIRYNDFYWFKKESDFHKNDIKVYIDKLSKNELNTFSSLYEQVNENRKISLDETNWKLSRSTCCYYLKNGKGTLMPTVTFEACKLLMKQKKNIQETDKQPRRIARNKNND